MPTKSLAQLILAAEPDPALISVFFVREADLSRGSIDMFIDDDGTYRPVSTQ
nr:hypothetical protein GCM10017611_74720 [Rhodococcus wratislaviensis]